METRSKEVNPEKWKYDSIYHLYQNPETQAGIQTKFAGYGRTNHGKRYALQVAAKFDRVLDIGCGHNDFIKSLRTKNKDGIYLGVDFSCPSADIREDITCIDFSSTLPGCYQSGWQLVTAFDVLEHLRIEQIDTALENMRKLGDRFIFTISFVPSSFKVEGETLHPTVRTADWWRAKLREYAHHVQQSGQAFSGVFDRVKPSLIDLMKEQEANRKDSPKHSSKEKRNWQSEKQS